METDAQIEGWKTYLSRTCGPTNGTAGSTGSCITFRRLADIDADVLHAAIRQGLSLPS